MKKTIKFIIPIISLMGIIFGLVNAEQVIVTAVVGNLNHTPVITSINPSSDPKLIARNKTQNYTIYLRDDEQDAIYYTITPQSGYVDPISGTINSSDFDSSSGAYINFKYLAPNTKPTPNPTKVTITINDGPNLVSKDINLYIY